MLALERELLLAGEGAQSGCETVAQSRYAEVRGLPIAAFGLAFSASLGVLLLLASAAGPEARAAAALLAFVALLAALAVDAVLLGVQLFAIRAFCRLCLLTYAINALAGAASDVAGAQLQHGHRIVAYRIGGIGLQDLRVHGAL